MKNIDSEFGVSAHSRLFVRQIVDENIKQLSVAGIRGAVCTHRGGRMASRAA